MSDLKTYDGRAHEKIAVLNKVIVGIVVVTVGLVLTLTFALGGIINDVLAEKKATYQNLVDKVNENNQKIDALSKKIEEKKK